MNTSFGHNNQQLIFQVFTFLFHHPNVFMASSNFNIRHTEAFSINNKSPTFYGTLSSFDLSFTDPSFLISIGLFFLIYIAMIITLLFPTCPPYRPSPLNVVKLLKPTGLAYLLWVISFFPVFVFQTIQLINFLKLFWLLQLDQKRDFIGR